MAPREGFEPPRPRDSGFRIHRNTGLCDLGNAQATVELEIRLFSLGSAMRVTVKHDSQEHVLQFPQPVLISEVLQKLGIHASTVLAVHDDTIVPHNSKIDGDIEIELITVSSGG